MRRVMFATSRNPGRAALAAIALRKPLQAIQRELAGTRRNEDIECVHRLRVASRRLRNALRLFAEELPAAARDGWRKRLRRVTKSLGAARDLDVQVDFLRQFLDGDGPDSSALRPGIAYVRATLEARRAAAQDDVVAALDRLESSRLLDGLVRWVKQQFAAVGAGAPSSDELRAEAARSVRARLADLCAYGPFVERPDAVDELHAMRIAAKHLRYTLEAYAPLYADELVAQLRWARQLQDWLGEIHDCDVWDVELGRILDESPSRRRARGIEHLRRERSERRAAVYPEFVAAWQRAAATGFWREFRRPFGSGQAGSARDVTAGASVAGGRQIAPTIAEDFASDQRLRPVLELAQSCHYEVGHTQQVTHLAQRLFDRLARLHGMDSERRYWLTSAALLHDVGWVKGRAGHHKTALGLILASPRLPWNPRVRRIIGSIARYHRKALPSVAHEHFAALSRADRADVRSLAALLRLADALDYSHAGVVGDVACRVTVARLSIRCRTTQAAEVECQRAMEKSDLAADVFRREIRVSWQQF